MQITRMEKTLANPAAKERFNDRTAKWRAKNKNKLREYHRGYRKGNPEKMAAHFRNRRAREMAAVGVHTGDQIASLVLKQCNKCANCFRRLTAKYHADHIMPLARGGSNDIANIQILCPRCNCRKHAKDPIQWAQEQGRLL
jgi:5-methylcytosine-specific restriction endonuclease McrA